MNTANQMAEEIYGLHCDIGRLEKEKEHWHTEFINEHEYAHMMEEQAEKAEAENAKLCQQLADAIESMGRVEERCAKLRELSVRMARALGVRSGWCTTDCAREFGCSHMDECPIDQELQELGVEV